jgi:Family of unknown function (DUF6335)
MMDHIAHKVDQDLADPWATEIASEIVTTIDLTELAPEVEAIHSPSWLESSDHNPELGKIRSQWQDLSAASDDDRDIALVRSKIEAATAIDNTTLTPDQNIVEELAMAAGIATPDQGILHTSELLAYRDAHRWELDPRSAEDNEPYQN